MKYHSNVQAQESPHRNHLYTLNTEAFCIEVDPIDRKIYQATAETAALGALTITRIETNAAVVSRKNEVTPDPAHKRFSLVFVEKGDLVISHHLGMASLREGQFTLMDNSHPRTMFVYTHVSLLLISIPRLVLQRYLPVPEEMEARILEACVATDPAEESLFDPVLSLWEHLKKGSLREFAPAISDNLLSSLAQVYSRQCEQQHSRTLRRISEAKQLIEEQLNNPELTVESLAAAMAVSSRYLRGLFYGSEKISHYILRRRLEESANQLANVLHQNISITAIAFRCGFNSTAHFSRAFKKQYLVTPREYRRSHQLAAAA
jgi:AraC-like DNA-binding protein